MRWGVRGLPDLGRPVELVPPKDGGEQDPFWLLIIATRFFRWCRFNLGKKPSRPMLPKLSTASKPVCSLKSRRSPIAATSSKPQISRISGFIIGRQSTLTSSISSSRPKTLFQPDRISLRRAMLADEHTGGNVSCKVRAGDVSASPFTQYFPSLRVWMFPENPRASWRR